MDPVRDPTPNVPDVKERANKRRDEHLPDQGPRARVNVRLSVTRGRKEYDRRAKKNPPQVILPDFS